MIHYRKNNKIVQCGEYIEYEKDNEYLYIYQRKFENKSIFIFSNFTSQNQKIDESILSNNAECIMGNYENHEKIF